MEPMTCREVSDFLGDYMDGELLPDVRSRFEAHLLLCPTCAAYVRSYAEARRLARVSGSVLEQQLLPEDVPEDLVTAILASTVGAKPRR
jgi:anti-sigma factor RsiW